MVNIISNIKVIINMNPTRYKVKDDLSKINFVVYILRIKEDT